VTDKHIIDDLKIAENKPLRKDEMKLFEFFECDYCGRLCEMPIEQYKTYTEDYIASAEIKCKKCTIVSKEKFMELRNEGMTIDQFRKQFNLGQVEVYKFINKWGLKGWRPTEPVKTQHNGADTQHKEPDTQHNEPLDHLPEVKELVIEPVVNESLTTESEKPTVNQPPTTDIVNHPPHYASGKIECIDAIDVAVDGLTPQEAVCSGNVIKYVWRFKRKNGKQDLLKAQWYLQRLIDLQED
jgi:transcription initiation factor TFIIIB Brf1 subunit/transcription initiation factor TFIIB